MAHAFSVFVNIGGKLNPSLAGAVSGAKSQVRGLEATLTGMAARISAPFIVAQKTIAATAKHLEKIQRAGRNLALSVTMPAALVGGNIFKTALERDKAGNLIEAHGATPGDRKEVEAYADVIAKKFGDVNKVLRTFDELLKAGFSLPSAKGAIDSVMKGSVIGDMVPAEVGNAVAKIATQFHLAMGTTEQAVATTNRVIDNLAYGANTTVGSLDDMIQAYKFVGGAAAAAGSSVEETNALIIGLVKAGQRGSEAGVALRSMYVSLVKPTKQGLATLARLGMNLGDYVRGGGQTGEGISKGLKSQGFDVPAGDLDKALASGGSDTEKQRQAVIGAVRAHVGENGAQDTQALTEAVNNAFAVSGNRIDLMGLIADLVKKGANQGDIARLFQGKQSSRIMSLLAANLPRIMGQVNNEAPGSTDASFDKKNQGLEKAVNELTASWQTLSNTLVKTVLPEITTVFSSISEGLKSLAASSPATLKIGVGLTAAAAAAGPLLFVLGAVGRLALAPFRLLVGAVRLLLWPLRAVTSAAVLMRGALMFTLPGAIVAGLATAGMFIYNNWKNLPVFFDSFKKSLMKNLGPGAEGNGQWLIDKAREAYAWFSDLTKALSADTWRGWGTAAGEAVAGIVTQLSDLVTQATPIVNDIIAKWKAADWAGLGAAIGSAIWQGIKSSIGSLFSLLGNAKLPAFGDVVTGMMNGPSGAATAPAGGAAPSTVPARALGGPVMRAKPYLIGERGPELFVPGMSGRIETNDTLRRLTADGAAIEATREKAAMSGSRGPTTITNHWTINGADDPREVVRQIDSRFGELLRQLEAEQRSLLSD